MFQARRSHGFDFNRPISFLVLLLIYLRTIYLIKANNPFILCSSDHNTPTTPDLSSWKNTPAFGNTSGNSGLPAYKPRRVKRCNWMSDCKADSFGQTTMRIRRHSNILVIWRYLLNVGERASVFDLDHRNV